MSDERDRVRWREPVDPLESEPPSIEAALSSIAASLKRIADELCLPDGAYVRAAKALGYGPRAGGVGGGDGGSRGGGFGGGGGSS